MCQMAQQMLNESVLGEHGCTCMADGRKFVVTDVRRIENPHLWELFKTKERQIAESFGTFPAAVRAESLELAADRHSWIATLEQRRLNVDASNTCYLLHGTTNAALPSIARHGLMTKFVGDANGRIYGNGVYFTRSSCKAAQYTDGRMEVGDGSQTILICRVALGRIAPIGNAQDWTNGNFPPEDYHSAKALSGLTVALRGQKQIHDEFIVYEDHACYPEFAITFRVDDMPGLEFP